MPKAVLTFSGTTPTYNATLEFDLPRFAGMKKDWSNIQFLDMNGKLLHHWLEHDENGVPNGHSYVKVPYIGKQGISIYMEWGEGIENGLGNIEETFLIGDDFDTLRTDVWTVTKRTGVTIETINSKLVWTINDASERGGQLYTSIPQQYPLIAKARGMATHYYETSWGMAIGIARNASKVYPDYQIVFPSQRVVTADFIWAFGYYNQLERIYSYPNDGTSRMEQSFPYQPVELNTWYSVIAKFTTNDVVWADFYKNNEYLGRLILDLTNHTTDWGQHFVIWWGDYDASGSQAFVDYVIVYPYLNPQPRLLTIYPLLPTAIYTLLSSAEVIKHLLGINIITSFDSIIDVTTNESISDMNTTSDLTSTTVANLSSELFNSIHDVSVTSLFSGTSFVRISLQTWNDYIAYDPVTWTVKQLNNMAEVIAKDGSVLETLNDTTAYSSALSTSGYIVISLKDTVRILEDITDALEYAILYPELVINSQQVKNKLVAVEAIAIFTERISYFIREAIAELLKKYKSSELITTASTEKEQLVENIATAYVKAFELISFLLNAFSHVSKLSVSELLTKLERVSSSLQEVVAVLTTFKKSEEIQSASTQEAKKFQSEIQSVLEVTKDLIALVTTLQKTYNEFTEIMEVSEFTTEEVISIGKVGENVQSVLLSILEQIRKLNLKMLRTLVDFENFQTLVNFKKFRTLVRKV